MKVRSSHTGEQSYSYHKQCTWLHCRSKWHWHCTSVDSRHAVEQSMKQSVTDVKKWMLWDVVVITLRSVVIIRFGCFPNVVGSSWPRRCCIIRHVYTSPVIHYHNTTKTALCKSASSLVHLFLTQLYNLSEAISPVQWQTRTQCLKKPYYGAINHSNIHIYTVKLKSVQGVQKHPIASRLKSHPEAPAFKSLSTRRLTICNHTSAGMPTLSSNHRRTFSWRFWQQRSVAACGTSFHCFYQSSLLVWANN